MKGFWTRREFARLLGSAAAVPAVSQALAEEKPSEPHGPDGIPAGFLWGAATASYQVEGAVHEGGRGASIWDTFSHTPGKVQNGDTGDVADDFFHRYRDDVQLMKRMGLQAFRFSVAWPRVFPSGSGTPLVQGLDFYKKLVDELHANGIEPFCTLYHWDLPQALQDNGGWENPDTARHLADYEGYVAGELSRAGVRHFFTMNEIRTFAELGYGNGTHAPGLAVGRKRLAQLTHTILMGHGLSVQAIRAHSATGVRVGLCENPVAPVPATLEPEDVRAAALAMREENAAYLTAILEGRYTEKYLRRLEDDAPRFTADEMRTISSPLDAVGLNFYTSTYVRSAPGGYEVLPTPSDFPHTASTWLTVSPECMHWGPRLVQELWQPKTIYITENGCSAADTMTSRGEVLDTGRVMYLRNCLGQMRQAIRNGAAVKGYFVWSLLDNFEWADGYSKRFGVVYVDYGNQTRTPKLSAQFYSSMIASNGADL
ncbi:beta-glucosidase [Bryocella elongata]|uniref:Beta-glucosidase n=1 Tax=Bryocella elongata TaxID=863522 RepID=A0A1H5UDC4_9BACT|nr:GH1 family beta-glucosidase [Bryocella elongata]SEF73103.1 beta-glucosidase [Bryocella elongata]